MFADYNKDGADNLKFTIKKGKPGIGTLAKQILSKTGKTGKFTIFNN